MSRLREIQQAFAQGVFQGDQYAVAEAIAPEESALRRVALYRRLIRNNYVQVLKVTYPVLYRLVGKQYFEIVARGYLKKCPSTRGDLFLYGCYLPTFLRSVDAPALITELARLEWACHEAYQAADSSPLSQDQLQATASVDPSHVTFQFDAAIQLLSFPFPVHRVWQVLQPDAASDEVIDLPLPEEATNIIVTRRDSKVQVMALPRIDYLLLEGLMRGADAASIERMAIESEPEFDFQRFWATVLNLRVLSGFSVKETS